MIVIQECIGGQVQGYEEHCCVRYECGCYTLGTVAIKILRWRGRACGWLLGKMHFPHRTGPPPPTQRVMHKSQRLVRRSLAARLTALHKCTSRVSASAMPQCLSEEQVRLFHEQGYLVLEKYWDASTVARLRTRMQHIVAGYGDIQSNKEASVFTTKEQGRNDNDYFLRSGSDISFFWEV